MKLTKRLIETTPPREKRFFLWDAELKGFGCCIHPGGRRSYVVRYRTEDGRDRRMVLGTHGALTPQLARQRAAEILGKVAGGADPATERQEARKAVTVAELSGRYLAEHAIKKKSGDEDRRKLEADILPIMGRLKVANVTMGDISTLHARMKARPVAANRVLALVRKMFGLAELWGMRPLGTNPAQHIQKYREQPRERYLSEDELSRFGEALDAIEVEDPRTQSSTAALRLLALTGARKNEVLTVRWEQLDEQHRCFWLPDSKTGARPLRLEQPALDLVLSLRRRSEWVFPSNRIDGPLRDISKALARAIRRAELTPFRVHDLRHTKASVAVGMGYSLPVTGALLGHARASTTERYAHLAADPVREAEGAVQAKIAAALGRRAVEIEDA